MNPDARVGPYLVLSRLGAGGMGEVWRARDERLGRDVALKVLPAGFAADPERLARFEREARATAALSHPNILAIHDVGVHDGQPYLVEELLEGESLRVRLLDGPLPVRDALSLGVQIARGLAAAHDKRIVHRDLKPDNVVVTSDGVPKILDFGLAKVLEPVSGDAATLTQAPSAATGPGQVMGSAAYMAPEQARGLAVDHRADIFAFGVLLHELLSGARPFRGQTLSDTVAAILKDEPEPLPEVIPAPVRALVRRCLEKRPEDRFSSARDIAFALQAQLEGAPRTAAKLPDQERPYPGLSAFGEADAKRFFGRDEEIASLWRKVPSRSLLALIGPSGVGKTSFIRAGIVPHAPAGWRCIVATPGQAPFASLARALAPAFTGDADAFPQLLDFHVPEVAQRLIARWRQRSDHGLIVVDQFEELFTLNPEDVQARFAELLGSLAALDGVHVLLSMRDDFFFACHRLVPLKDLFLDVTPLGPPSSAGLRSALVEPAKAMGFGFEDEALVDDMVHAVEGERGALPLLAFAAASLWERRDQETRRLTRSAYEALGGVAGALAQHAEATLERVGAGRLPLVRELFRNLVTSQRTRCVLDIEELLSVFPEPDRNDAREALSRLVDARLLTAFEVDAPDGSRHDRVELVHESLLTAWPRLVRWRTEDEGGAHLRDQLRQAARLWEEKGRPEDLLWTGTSYQEYQVWRARYPGGLSEAEETFGCAMATLAGRRRRRRRIIFTVVLAVVVVVAAALGVLLRRSVAETAQREAGQLLALGRLKTATVPSGGLAYAVASLERADNLPARRFAVESLWKGPPMFVLTDPVGHYRFFWSSDGRWLALSAWSGVALWERDTNTRRLLTPATEEVIGFTPDGGRLITEAKADPKGNLLHLWALPEGRLEHTVETGRDVARWRAPDYLVMGPGPDYRLEGSAPGAKGPEARREFYRMSLDGARRERLEGWERLRRFAFDPTGARLLVNDEGRLTVKSADAVSTPGRDIGMHKAAVRWGPLTDRAVTGDESGEVRIWDLTAGRLERTLRGPSDARLLAVEPSGRYVAAGLSMYSSSRSLSLFDLAAPDSAEPVSLLGAESTTCYQLKFSPDGRWIATSYDLGVTMWPTAGARSLVVGRHEGSNVTVAFAKDGHLLSTSDLGVVKRWPLDPADHTGAGELWRQPGAAIGGTLELDPAGRFALVEVHVGATALVVPLDGSPVQVRGLTHLDGKFINCWSGRLDPQGRRLATYVFTLKAGDLRGIRVLDLDTGAERTLDTRPAPGDGCEKEGTMQLGAAVPVWLADGRLLSDGDGGIRAWDPAAGTSTLLRPCRGLALADVVIPTPDSRSLVRLTVASVTALASKLVVVDLVSGGVREITSHGARVSSVALDRSGGVLLTGDADGVVRVGPLSGEEPHLLYGHTGPVTGVAVSPDGRRIASGSEDGTIRLWDMPDLATPPLHTLPHDELLAKLRSYTNLRAVRDPVSDTGWKIEVGPFPGWAVVPEWWP